MSLFANLKRRSYPSALDVLCAKETITEIFQAMTPHQLLLAACLLDGMRPARLAEELDVSRSAITARQKNAQERVARAMLYANAMHLHGDVLARTWKEQETYREYPTCVDCGQRISVRSTRCQRCSNIRTGKMRRKADK